MDTTMRPSLGAAGADVCVVGAGAAVAIAEPHAKQNAARSAPTSVPHCVQNMIAALSRRTAWD
jgi:hypothetical protein